MEQMGLSCARSSTQIESVRRRRRRWWRCGHCRTAGRMHSVSHRGSVRVCCRAADPAQHVTLAIEQEEHHLLLRWNGKLLLKIVLVHVDGERRRPVAGIRSAGHGRILPPAREKILLRRDQRSVRGQRRIACPPLIDGAVPVVDIRLLCQLEVQKQQVAVAVKVRRQRDVLLAQVIEADRRKDRRLRRAHCHHTGESEQNYPGYQGTHVSTTSRWMK